MLRYARAPAPGRRPGSRRAEGGCLCGARSREWPCKSDPARGLSLGLSPAAADMTTSGKGEIRTLGTLSGTHAFQACQLNRSCTFPSEGIYALSLEKPRRSKTLFRAEDRLAGWGDKNQTLRSGACLSVFDLCRRS